ncbi:MAG TPA: hypothetical protein ENK99_07270 [Campylobacterales bacterium]|nr:hypothetical protein [Campylobacterales bacterium]
MPRDVATHDEPVTTPDNELYDPDMDDRFTLIASPKSLYTGNLLYVYHDKKYEDIFAIPDLTNICNKDSYDNLIGMELKMYGTAIGLHYRKMIEDKEVPDNTNPVNFKDTPSPVTATTHLRNSIVSDMMYPIHDADLKVDNVEIAKSRRIIPIQYISLGDASAISNSKPIPVFHVLSHNTTSEHLMYNSHYIPPEFIFPLQF